MPRRSSYQRELDAALLALPVDDEGMLGELDGFLTGVLVCPDLLMPSEWLPHVWGGADEETAPVFESGTELERLVGLVMRLYNAIVRDLSRGRLAPLYDIDERNDDILWELWMAGFAKAIALRPDACDDVLESSDENAAAAMAGLMTMAVVADESGQDTNARKLLDALQADTGADAADLIPLFVMAVHDWRLRHRPTPQDTPPPRTKIGRNDPCPCGSGRKYKKCCGLN